ncbi:MAG: ABC transporter ATP-binding protein, partial [Bdellovibrionales bacterium]|nr:ABC transporter ATP-binding protein [Bdellovibrionales bacterium]
MEIPKNPLKFAIWCSTEHRRFAIGAFMAVLCAALTSRLIYYLIRIITDTAIQVEKGQTDLQNLWKLIVLFPLAYILNEAIWRCSGFCGMRWITGMTATAHQKLFDYLSKHSASFFSERYAGAITNKISNAAKGVEELTAQTLWQFSPLLIGFAADIYLTSLSHYSISVTLLCSVTLFISMNVLFVKRLSVLAYQRAEASSNLKGKLVDSASNIDTVQFAAELEHERRYIGSFIDQQRSTHLKEWWYSEWVLIANGIMLALFMAVTLAQSVWLLQQGLITIGSLVLVITVVIALERNLFFIGQHMTRSAGYYGQIKEGLLELLAPYSIKESGGAPQLLVKQGSIQFNRISFSYGNNAVFDNFSLKLDGGEKVGLVGPSGAGKSTLVSLLLRQFEVSSGEILVDGIKIPDITLDSLRRSISYVPQTTSLFHRPIMDNIRYGKLSASDNEVIEAARLAQADEFIRSLPDAYGTYVGERGVKLSGGQRQRISIARAFLKNAPILILDEATSALDSESERAIQAVLIDLMQGKTVLAIAHRLSTLRAMDRLVVVQNGQVVEDGHHDQLLANGGLYSRLWNSQVEG